MRSLLCLLLYVLTALLLSCCATRRHSADATATQRHAALSVALSDTMLRVSTLEAADRSRLVTLTETLRTTYLDPASGLPTRIDEHIIAQADSQADRTLSQHQSTERDLYIAAASAHAADSISQHDDTQTGDAARTPWQSLLHHLFSLDVILPIVMVVFLYVHLRWFAPWLTREK